MTPAMTSSLVKTSFNELEIEDADLITVEPRLNENPGKTKDILQPNYSIMYGKEPRFNESSAITNSFSQSLRVRLEIEGTVFYTDGLHKPIPREELLILMYK